MSNETMQDTQVEPLYWVSCRMDDRGHKRVPVSLFRFQGEPPFRAEDYLPPGFVDDTGWPPFIDNIKAFFSRHEADRLVKYITNEWAVEDVKMYPESPHVMSPGMLSVGGCDDVCIFTDCERELAISVAGYFDFYYADSGPCVDIRVKGEQSQEYREPDE